MVGDTDINLEYLKNKNGYEIDGIWYPRVTSICNIIAKPGLEKWLANQGSFTAMKIKRRKIANFGTLVHNTIEQIVKGESLKVPSVVRPSINAFLQWLEKHQVRVLEIEKRILSENYNYSGTLDLLAEINGKLGILDLKTSSNIWDDFFVQTAAYFQAYNEKSTKKAKTHWILRVDQYQECVLCGAKRRKKGDVVSIKKGSKICNHKWSEFKGLCRFKKVKDHQTYFETFLTAKKLWELCNRDWLSQIKNYPQNIKNLKII